VKKKTSSVSTLPLLIISMIVLVLDTRIANAEETIYIRSDGSVDPIFNPNADIDWDGDIAIYDVVIAASRYGYAE